MNTKQKVLTVIALLIFLCGVFTLFSPPVGVTSGQNLADIAGGMIILGIFYAFLFRLFKEKSKKPDNE